MEHFLEGIAPLIHTYQGNSSIKTSSNSKTSFHVLTEICLQ